MGFTPDEVRDAIRRLAEEGQSIDLNDLIDDLTRRAAFLEMRASRSEHAAPPVLFSPQLKSAAETRTVSMHERPLLEPSPTKEDSPPSTRGTAKPAQGVELSSIGGGTARAEDDNFF